MKIIRSVKEMSKASDLMRRKRKSIGLVPTMGALHGGHLSLIRRARKENDCVVVSIFVNPTQFGPQEDFKKYPRDTRRDSSLCRKEGVDIIFVPLASQVYPTGFKTYICVEDLSSRLCGKIRPGHFKGVATIVAKLFNIVRPDTAYFGQKDAQQAVIIKRMNDDLNFPVKIKILPIVREKGGLAMSSRNIYLDLKEKRDALAISQSLKAAKDLIGRGNSDPRKIIKRISRQIRKKKSAKIDYIAVVDRKELLPLKKIKDQALIALAVRIGKTRLIDNIMINNA